MMASVEDLLRAREERAKRQRQWIRRRCSTVISFTLNIPGPEKQSLMYTRIHQAGLASLRAVLPVTEIWATHPPTGSEAIISSPWGARRIKSITVALEQNHPLGRIFDLDVLGSDELTVSRVELGFPPRVCLLCDDEAVACARSRRHPLAELLRVIELMAGAYFNQPLSRGLPPFGEGGFRRPTAITLSGLN